ncbi:winged helix-turn-helix transcriptional regulator [Psychrobacillus sp. INOP01]|uniref:ArsR/SmtB family transcription factor n=1 Tax=Psychrobacillus sp. INOP01 TaxID=2829187 RepID=UPI001BA9FCF0|nr:metalloregulator ArsR/SmtB family transcription factor [Psychrobacillus sp. INOP01]QUG42444.1 winged helix-turn-helix transcriptional regulator [Psychrobacillus sp. INOP01]
MNDPIKKVDVFQAIADPTRRDVLRLLANGDRSIAEISSHYDMSRTAIVKHLIVLTEAGLVNGKKLGREKVYHLQPEPLTEVKQWLDYYEKFWNNKLSRLKFLVENEDIEK